MMSSISCEQCQSLLLDYHHGELPAEDASDIASHLGTCSSCAKEYCRLHADLMGIGSLLAEAPRPEVHRALREKVARAFPEPWHRRMTKLFALRVPVYQPVLILAAVVAGIWLAPIAERTEPREQKIESRTVLDNYDSSTLIAIDENVL